jgi:hypothetical protein
MLTMQLDRRRYDITHSATAATFIYKLQQLSKYTVSYTYRRQGRGRRTKNQNLRRDNYNVI